MKVYRLNTDGSNDTSFNNDGMRNVYFPSSVDNLANAVVMSGQDRLRDRGRLLESSRHGYGQLTSDGRNDTAFGASGTGRTYVDFGFGIPMFGNCSFKLTARSSESANRRSSTTTTLSQSRASTPTDRWTRRFSGDGKFAHDFGNGDSYGWAGAIDEDGRIVIAGQYNNGANDKAFVMRRPPAHSTQASEPAASRRLTSSPTTTRSSTPSCRETRWPRRWRLRIRSLGRSTGRPVLKYANIIYDSQGGSAVTDGDATTTTGGAIATLPTDPTRTGYTFNGWFTANTSPCTRSGRSTPSLWPTTRKAALANPMPM